MKRIIHGVCFKELVTHTDERGFFREIVRTTDDFFAEGFGQWSHSWMREGVVKAWHMHRIQTDWWYVGTGLLRVGLHDRREGSSTRGATMEFRMGGGQPPRVLKIPPGVAHGCEAIGGPVNLIYVTSHVYNPADEIRFPSDDPEAGVRWGAGMAQRAERMV
jgi:dTDP-4-dehydrorhamnose 3,5-epimerase